MDLKTDFGIIKLMNELKGIMTDDLFDRYWNGFLPLNFGFYNDKKVFLTTADASLDLIQIIDDIYIYKWEDKFVGNTCILLNNQYIGIWDLGTIGSFKDKAALYAGIVHELFHAYQNFMNYSRFGNEYLLTTYPFTKENIAISIKERESLLKAVYEKNDALKCEFISDFIFLREKRKKLIGKYIEYEYGLESTEGTASYVEYKALVKENNLPDNYVIGNFWDRLYNKAGFIKRFRTGLYATGMFICLLLDDLLDKWQDDYINSNIYLYDYLKKKVKIIQKQTEKIDFDDEYAALLINDYKENVDAEFRKFHQSGGYRVIIKGNFLLNGFDPMNLIRSDNYILHKHFIKFALCNKEIFYNKPVISKYEEEMSNIIEIELYAETPPKVKEDTVYIDELGYLKGNILKNGDRYIIYTGQTNH